MAKKYIALGYPTSLVIRYAGVANSTWYSYLKFLKKPSTVDKRKYNKGRPIPGFSQNVAGNDISDAEIINSLKKYRAQIEFHNGGGYIKLKHYLRRDFGLVVNKKKVYRLCKENKLLLPKKKKSKWRNRKICINRIVTSPNQLWEFDIKYGYIHGEDRYFFVLIFIDVFMRKVVSFYVGTSCTGKDLSFTLDQAIKKEKIGDENSLTIRSDHGTQMKSNVFKKHILSLELKLDHEFIPPSTPNKNAHVESFNSIYEIEFLQVRYFNNFADAYKQTVEFIDFYNNYRLHSSLKYKSPMEAEELLKRGCLNIKPVKL